MSAINDSPINPMMGRWKNPLNVDIAYIAKTPSLWRPWFIYTSHTLLAAKVNANTKKTIEEHNERSCEEHQQREKRISRIFSRNVSSSSAA